MRSRLTIHDGVTEPRGRVISLQPIRRFGTPAPSAVNDPIDMAVLGRFLTELCRRSHGGSVKIRTSPRGRRWRVSVVDTGLQRRVASANTLAEALERALQKLLP
jgi:hypothetical protein